MVDHFLKLVKGGKTPQEHLATCLHRLVLPMLTAAVAAGEDAVSKENIDFIVHDVLDTRNPRNLAGAALPPPLRLVVPPLLAPLPPLPVQYNIHFK